MNYCTICRSYYQVAGTCNCFAANKIGPVIGTTVPAFPGTYVIYNPAVAQPSLVLKDLQINCNAVVDIAPIVANTFRNAAAAQHGTATFKAFNL